MDSYYYFFLGHNLFPKLNRQLFFQIELFGLHATALRRLSLSISWEQSFEWKRADLFCSPLVSHTFPLPFPFGPPEPPPPNVLTLSPQLHA